MIKTPRCKICSSNTSQIFKADVLGKYSTAYFQCDRCKFIQTEHPHWQEEAYSNAITDLDIGIVWRNIRLSKWLGTILKNNYSSKAKFLDYAGGYGLFVRIMRDKGFDFYREDRYCENLFARHFDITDLPRSQKFELVTAFEVFEHLVDPLADISEMLNYSDNIIFTTELQPDKEIHSANDWWYFTPETGQHIAFYTKKTLQLLASQHGCAFYSNDQLHIISKDKNAAKLFDGLTDEVHDVLNLDSGLLQQDFEYVHAILKERQLIALPYSKQKKQKIDQLSLLIDELAKIKVLSYQSEETSRKISQDLAKSQEQLKQLAQDLQLSHEQVGVLTKELHSSHEQVGVLTKELHSSHEQVGVLTKELQSSNDQIGVLTNELQASRERVAALTKELGVAQADIQRMQNTKIWKAAEEVRKFIPQQTINSLSNQIRRSKSEIIRNLEGRPKKIVYVGHSYHSKTGSTRFLVDLLKTKYEVEEVLDESWSGKPFPSLEFVDSSYHAVVFFQNIPPIEYLNKLECQNIVFFPMYDATVVIESPEQYWKQYQSVKIISFSSSIMDHLRKANVDGLYAQYFPAPNPAPISKTDILKVFFWQRTSDITIKSVIQLFGKSKCQIHIHRAIDPGFEFVAPTPAQEKKFKITYSDWFETREELHSLIRECDIYIAPRKNEGIGQSFLEAMAMGKAVIAANQPTMNEYISHSVNGYLFNIDKPQPLDLSRINQVRKKALESVEVGYNNWLKKQQNILAMIG